MPDTASVSRRVGTYLVLTFAPSACFAGLMGCTGPTAWIIGAFGAAPALVGIVPGSLAWRRGGALALRAREAA